MFTLTSEQIAALAEEKAALQARLADIEAISRVIGGTPAAGRKITLTSTGYDPQVGRATHDPTLPGSTQKAQERPRRGRRPMTAANGGSGSGEAPRASRGASLGERVLAAVATGVVDKSAIVKLLHPALPMHVGTAIQRHIRGGRLIEEGGRYSLAG